MTRRLTSREWALKVCTDATAEVVKPNRRGWERPLQALLRAYSAEVR